MGSARFVVVLTLSLLLVSVAAAQDVVWVRQFGSPNLDVVMSIDTALDGTTYVAGFTFGVLPGQTGAGAADGFVRKFDASGGEVWTRQFGTAGDDFVDSIDIDATGNIVVAGQTDGAFAGQVSAGGTDAFVRCYSANGSIQWTRQFGTASSDGALDVGTDGGSNIVVVGQTGGTLPGQSSAGSLDAFARRLDVNGNVLWTRQFGSAAADAAFAVAVSSSGQAIVGGTVGAALPGQTHLGLDDAFIRSYSSSGTEAWTRQFGTPEREVLHAVRGSGPIYVGGKTMGEFPGEPSWGNFDAFAGAFAADGTPGWVRQFGTPENDVVYAVTADSSGNVFVGGDTDGTFPGEASAGLADAFVGRYTADGSAVWIHQFGTVLRDGVRGVQTLGPLDVMVGGFAEGSLPGASSSGGGDAYLLRLSQPSCVNTAAPDGHEDGAISGQVHGLEPSVPDPGLRRSVHELNCTLIVPAGL